MSIQIPRQSAARPGDREIEDQREDSGEPDLVLEQIRLPEEYIKPILMAVPPLDLSAPSKINKIYYTVKVPELKSLELEVNYGGLEAEIANMSREKSLKREVFLNRLLLHLFRASVCLAGCAIVILATQGRYGSLPTTVLTCFVVIEALLLIGSLWDLVTLRRLHLFTKAESWPAHTEAEEQAAVPGAEGLAAAGLPHLQLRRALLADHAG